MSLYTLKEICLLARSKGFAVPAFNCYNFETVTWAVEAAEEEKSPVIIMIYPGFEKLMPLEYFTSVARLAAQRADVPVAVHLDHCYEFEHILRAAQLGCTGVMVDASAKPYEENAAITAEIVRAVHALGSTVEAELGKVGSAGNTQDFTDNRLYTDPQQAATFVEETGVDALAVAIGSAHGNYVATPHLDISRLDAIRRATDVPLVLHGGSGIPAGQVQEAVRHGITKMNIATEYFSNNYRVAKRLIQEDTENKLDGFELSFQMCEPLKNFVKSKIRLLKP